MSTNPTLSQKDGLDALLFGAEGVDLLDFKCFRGDRPDVDEADIKKQIHSAFMQRKMKRASVSVTAPVPNVPLQDVKEFVAGL